MTVRMRSNSLISGHGFRARYDHVPPRSEYLVGVVSEPPCIVKYDRFRIETQVFSLSPESQRPSAIDFDPIEEYLYYTDIGRQPFIGRIRSDGSENEVIVNQGVAKPLGIVIGFLSKLLYWTDEEREEVSVSTLDGRFRKILIPAGSRCSTPRGIELSSDQKYLFWTCRNLIEKSKSDGTGRTTVINAVFEVMSIAIDHKNQKLFWTDISTGIVHSSDFNGNDPEDVQSHQVFIASHGFIVEDGTFFWSVPDENIIFITREESDIISGLTLEGKRASEGLYYYKSDRAISEQHVCSQDVCSQLCLPNGTSYSCEEVAPIIRGCPADIILTTSVSVSAVVWIEPTAVSRGIPPANLTYVSRTKPPGSSFLWGNTNVRYRFQDDLGNEAECAFNIILIQPTTTHSTVTEWSTTPTVSLTGFPLMLMAIGIFTALLIIAFSLAICITCCCPRRRAKRRDPPPARSQYVMQNRPVPSPPPYSGIYDEPVAQPPPYRPPVHAGNNEKQMQGHYANYIHRHPSNR